MQHTVFGSIGSNRVAHVVVIKEVMMVVIKEVMMEVIMVVPRVVLRGLKTQS